MPARAIVCLLTRRPVRFATALFSWICVAWICVACNCLSACTNKSRSDDVEPTGFPNTAVGAPVGQEAVEAHGSVREQARERELTNAAQLEPKVIFLGDSISAGLHLPAEQAFPAVLARKLAAAGHPFRLVNAGVSGDTSAGGLRRLDWLLRQKPDIVVVELGANDGLRALPLAHLEQNLRAILRQIGEHGATPLLLGMRIPPSYGADYAQGFAALYPRIAAELSVSVVPFFMEGVAGVAELNLEDGIHPTAPGHEKLANNVLKALEQLLTRIAQPQK